MLTSLFWGRTRYHYRDNFVKTKLEKRPMLRFSRALLSMLALTLSTACSSTNDNNNGGGGTPSGPQAHDWPCEIAAGQAAPDSLSKLGCATDFDAMASQPLDASIPGARSGKVILDLLDDGQPLYFQNSQKFQIHYEFAHSHLNGMNALAIGDISSFNPQYTAPLVQRRFLLGAVTYYEGPQVWALEIAPYDTSTPEMIGQLYHAVADHAFFGPLLKFHPTSDDVQSRANGLGPDVPTITTDELYAKIDYQPLNLGEAVGTVKILRADQLDSEYVSAHDIVVLDSVPNDIAPTAGIVTEMFQTPLSHINVLARNRKTPNMGLRNATTLAAFTENNGKYVRLTVGAFEYKVTPISAAEADAYWAAHPLEPVTVPEPDLTVTDLRDLETVTVHTDEPPYVTFEAIQQATRTFGAKAANYSVFATDPAIPNKPGFAIPVYYYYQFMDKNGFFQRVREFEQDPTFVSDAAVRATKLAQLRADILATPLDADFSALLKAKMEQKFPGGSVRFRSSTNAEDLDGFPCAGCYDSHTGDPAKHNGDQLAAAAEAIKKTWATAWNLRTYEERKLHSIDHTRVAMALLVHTNFPAEEANGVAVTNNIFDTSGNAPGFYVNVQWGGEFEVVHPPAGVTSDSFLNLYNSPGQPIIYYTHSNVLPADRPTVLTALQVHQLGQALDVIHRRFQKAYQKSPTSWYGMDVEFKFDDFADETKEPTLYVKQARPYPPPEGAN